MVNFGMNLETLIGSLGTAGRGMAGAAFGAAANDLKVCTRIASAMFKAEKGFGADWATAPTPEKDVFIARAQASLREVQQIIAGK